MKTESCYAFARRLGVARSTISRYGRQGRLVMVGDLVAVEPSIAKLAEAEAEAKAKAVKARKAAAARRQTRAKPKPTADLDPDAPSNPEAMRQYKAIRLQAEIDTLQLQRDLRAGVRHYTAAAHQEAEAVGGVMRGALERLIDQIAPQLAVLPDPAERAALLEHRIGEIRKLVRAEFPRALRRIRRASKPAAEAQAADPGTTEPNPK